MKNLSPAELAVVANVDRDRVTEDLAALVAIPSLTGNEGEVQTEVALRMTTAGLDVERVDTPAIDLVADPDFPGVEVARDTHPVVVGKLTGDAAGRRVLIAGHVDVVSAGDELGWASPPFRPRIDDGVLYGPRRLRHEGRGRRRPPRPCGRSARPVSNSRARRCS